MAENETKRTIQNPEIPNDDETTVLSTDDIERASVGDSGFAGIDFGANDDELRSALLHRSGQSRSVDLASLVSDEATSPHKDADRNELPDGTTIIGVAPSSATEAASGDDEGTTVLASQPASLASTRSADAGVTANPMKEPLGSDATEFVTYDATIIDLPNDARLSDESPNPIEEPFQEPALASVDPVAPEVRDETGESEGAPNRKRAATIAIPIVLAAALAIGIFAAANPTGQPPSSSAPTTTPAQPSSYRVSIACIDSATGQEIAEEKTEELEGRELARAIAAPSLDGYVAIGGSDDGVAFYTRADADSGTACEADLSSQEPRNHSIVFSYARVTSYTVRYLEAGSAAEIAPAKIAEGWLAGDVATEAALPVEGYTLAAGVPESTSITLSNESSQNVIDFTYEKRPVESSSSKTNAAASPSASPSYPSAAPSYDDALDGTWGN